MSRQAVSFAVPRLCAPPPACARAGCKPDVDERCDGGGPAASFARGHHHRRRSRFNPAHVATTVAVIASALLGATWPLPPNARAADTSAAANDPRPVSAPSPPLPSSSRRPSGPASMCEDVSMPSEAGPPPVQSTQPDVARGTGPPGTLAAHAPSALSAAPTLSLAAAPAHAGTVCLPHNSPWGRRCCAGMGLAPNCGRHERLESDAHPRGRACGPRRGRRLRMVALGVKDGQGINALLTACATDECAPYGVRRFLPRNPASSLLLRPLP